MVCIHSLPFSLTVKQSPSHAIPSSFSGSLLTLSTPSPFSPVPPSLSPSELVSDPSLSDLSRVPGLPLASEASRGAGGGAGLPPLTSKRCFIGQVVHNRVFTEELLRFWALDAWMVSKRCGPSSSTLAKERGGRDEGWEEWVMSK